jgi:SNF2 family DNA or RNA helicase
LVLTGTPVENSTMDLWSQMSFVNPGLLGTKKFFKDEFVTPIEKKQDEQKSAKLATLIKPFILRRHKSQVATELPDKIENIHYSSMTTMQEEKYEEVKSFYRDKILEHIEHNGIRKSQMILLQGLTQLRQLANHPKMVDKEYLGDSGKMEDVTHMLTSIISEGHKVLVFSQFVKHLALMKDYLERSHIKFAYLDGSTKDREKQVNLFQENEEISVFLISLKAGGLGLNLTAADYVFLLDPWWNPAIEQQAVDRAHRIGQKQQVFTYKFITTNTVEEKILALQERKVNLARDLISTEENFMKNLTQEDIRSILA